MNGTGRYLLVRTIKDVLITEESDNENVVINLINDNQYSLKKDDVLEEVDAKFVAEFLKNHHAEVKGEENVARNFFYLIITIVIAAIGFEQSNEISIFVILFWLSLLLFLINHDRKNKKKFKEIFEKNYYSAFKRIR